MVEQKTTSSIYIPAIVNYLRALFVLAIEPFERLIITISYKSISVPQYMYFFIEYCEGGTSCRPTICLDRVIYLIVSLLLLATVPLGPCEISFSNLNLYLIEDNLNSDDFTVF